MYCTALGTNAVKARLETALLNVALLQAASFMSPSYTYAVQLQANVSQDQELHEP